MPTRMTDNFWLEEIAGNTGSGGATGLTNAQLRATPVPVSSLQLPSTIGQKAAAASTSVVLSSDGPFATNFGLTNDSAATTDTGTFSFLGLFKRSLQSLTSLITNTTPPVTTAFRNTGLTSTAVAVKASAGAVWGWNFINVNTVPVYVKFYDALVGGTTVGTTTPLKVIAVPANGAFYLGRGLVNHGSYATGITIAALTGLADSSTAAPTVAIHAEIGFI